MSKTFKVTLTRTFTEEDGVVDEESAVEAMWNILEFLDVVEDPFVVEEQGEENDE